MKIVILLALFAGCAQLRPLPDDQRSQVMTREQLNTVVQQHSSEIRDCYELATKVTPGLTGTVALNFRIDDRGQAQKVSEVKTRSSLHNEALSSCLAGKVATWKFPASPSGDQIEVTQEFPFNK